MEDHGYNLRQRPFPVTVSTQSEFPISTTVSTVTADSLATIPQPGTGLARAPTMASQGQESVGSGSVQESGTLAEPIDPIASSPGYSPGCFPGYQSNVVNVVTTAASNVEFASVVTTVSNVEFAQTGNITVSSQNVQQQAAVQFSTFLQMYLHEWLYLRSSRRLMLMFLLAVYLYRRACVRMGQACTQ